MKKNNQTNPKVVFYTSISRTFRTTRIANLYEICQVYPVVLLSEKLDKETEEILKNKKLFPKLEKIVPVDQALIKKRDLLAKNFYVYKLAKNIIREYKPTIFIMAGDTSLFDFYLMRLAKKINALYIVLNSDLRTATGKEMSLRTDLTHTYFGLPSFLPFRLKLLLVRIRKYLGYFLYNWILPLLVGQAPFFGKSSRILYSMSGFRANNRIVCSKQDYNLSLKEGIPEKKLAILEHPLKRENTKRFFERTYLLDLKNKTQNKTKNLILLYPEEPYGFKRDDHSLIKETEMRRKRIEIVSLIVNTLKEWKIFIKPHPAATKTGGLKNLFEAISPFVTFINPSEPIDQYIEISNVIVGFPPVSSVLFTTTLQCPEKPVLSLDLPPQEIFGDCYKDFDGIEHIDSEEKLINILRLIRDNKYHKECKENISPRLTRIGREISKSEPRKFLNTVEALEYFIKKS